MGSITTWLQGLSGPLVYAVVGALVFAEDALFVGFVLPGETAAVLGGVTAGAGSVNLGLLIAVVVFAAIAGDSVGYEVGRHLGPRLLDLGFARKHHHRIERGQRFIRDKGPAAVFLGRFVALLRALVPTLAGVSRMPYRRFVLFNAIGGIVWGVGFVLLGFFAGNAYKRVEHVAGRVVGVVVAVAVVAAVGTWAWRRHHREVVEERLEEAEEREQELEQQAQASEQTTSTQDRQSAEGNGQPRDGRPTDASADQHPEAAPPEAPRPEARDREDHHPG